MQCKIAVQDHIAFMRYTSFRTLFGTLGTEKLHILADLVAPKLCVMEHAHARKSQRTWVLGRT